MITVGVRGSGVSTRLMQPAALSLGITLSATEGSLESAVTHFDERAWGPLVDGLVVLAARSPQGQVVLYPVTRARGERFTAPADISDGIAHEVQIKALEIIKERALIGVVAITFSESQLEVIDLFEGPHRAGLWTIDGARTDQFDQHLRALLNLPFGSPEMSAPLALSQMVIGGEKPDLFRPFLHLYARDPGLRVHLYGVPVSSGVEIGHVTVLGREIDELIERADHAAGYINGRIEE